MQTQTQKSKLTPKFFFISLGVLVSLITSVSSFLVLLFEVLNKKFPEVLNSTYIYGYNFYNFETIRASLATIIIFFPIFILLSYLWNKESKKEMSSVSLIIRKWMVYLILFLASLVIIIDLVTLVRYFVSGEITNRFIFKVIGTLFIAGLIDLYYILKINLKNNKSKKLGLPLSIISGLLFAGLIICSFSVMGSPSKQRDLRLDEQRVNDLQNIQYQIINYWQQKETLPNTLADLNNPLSGRSLSVDPEFEKGFVYEYEVKGKLSFDICATFSEEMPKGWQEYGDRGVRVSMVMQEAKPNEIEYAYGLNSSWDHKIGRTCFTRIIDKDLYLPFKD